MRNHMAITLLCVLLFAATTSAMHVNDPPVLTEDFIAEVNRLNGGMWTATYEGTMRHKTVSQAKRLMGVRTPKPLVLPPRRFTQEELHVEVPDTFDSSKQWPNCPTITEIRDQSDCGSCWAIAAASAMSDRYCTIGGVQDVRIATADLLACCTSCGFGCDGGYPSAAWQFFTNTGIVSEYCQPYPFPACAHHTNSTKYPPCSPDGYDTPQCNATCTDTKIPLIKYKGASSYSVSGEEAFKRELYLRGPFEVDFTVYEDFLAYKKGVYKHVSGRALGGHAVRLVGWGELNGVPYWKIANSWNEEWGLGGYFLIARGVNECGIEDDGCGGTPSIPQPRLRIPQFQRK